VSNDSGVAGIALYFELDSPAVDIFLTQVIVVPAAITPDGELLPQHIRLRTITGEGKQPKWRVQPTEKGELSDIERSSGYFTQEGNAVDALKRGLDVLRTSFKALEPTTYGEYVIVKQPLLVQFSDQDAMDMKSKTTPRGLIGRINRLREANEFPALPGRED
jgi:hypothetical protein